MTTILEVILLSTFKFFLHFFFDILYNNIIPSCISEDAIILGRIYKLLQLSLNDHILILLMISVFIEAIKVSDSYNPIKN